MDGIASVASFFVSRIDTAVDKLLDEKLQRATGAERQRLERLYGKTAIANARLAYQSYKRIFSGPRWEALAARGARRQRLLWASTSVKNPRYRDVMYVEELIGAGHHQHDAGRDAGGVPRSRPRAARAWRRT